MERMIRITIFLILAQTLVHLAPKESYEKYLKLLVKWFLLALLLSPIMALLTGQSLEKIVGSILMESTSYQYSVSQSILPYDRESHSE